MSITDELRKYANRFKNSHDAWSGIGDDLTAIADRIDAEHERAMADAYLSGTPTDEKLTELGWIRLPKDADGEYIRVGDEMCGYGWPNGGVYCRAIVNEVTILVGPQDGAYRGWLMWAANECRHYHAPTVEDVLREFADGWDFAEGAGKGDSYMKTFAAKLRLVEGEDA